MGQGGVDEEVLGGGRLEAGEQLFHEILCVPGDARWQEVSGRVAADFLVVSYTCVDVLKVDTLIFRT